MKAAADQEKTSHPAAVGIEQIVSGGQTGVDRAALDVALELGISCGGWCPKGRKAEDGRIPGRYPLQETPTARYAERTERNVVESDGTLILTSGPVAGGTALTRACAERIGRPCKLIDRLEDAAARVDIDAVKAWLNEHAIRKLNIAGPRESQQPGIYGRASEFLRQLLAGSGSPTIPDRRGEPD